MNLRKNINKKGSYLVEATITLPFIIAAMTVLLSIILMYSCIENSNFIMVNEMRRASVEALEKQNDAGLLVRVNKKIKTQHYVNGLHLKEYVYRGSKWNENELILLSYQMSLCAANPIGLSSNATYDFSCAARAYVGKTRDMDPMSGDEFEETGDETVFIFPKAGEKFHNKGCNVLKAACKGVILSKEVKRKYTGCKICHSKDAKNGTFVYVFQSGGAYHLPSCGALERNYIEIMKRTARKRGYTPCLKCGG